MDYCCANSVIGQWYQSCSFKTLYWCPQVVLRISIAAFSGQHGVARRWVVRCQRFVMVCRKKYFQTHRFDRRTGERRFWSMQVFPPGYLLYIRDSTSLPSYIRIHEIMIPNNQKIMPWDFQKFQDFCYDHRMRRSLLMSLQKEKTEKSSGEEWLGSACVYMFYCTKVLCNLVCNS